MEASAVRESRKLSRGILLQAAKNLSNGPLDVPEPCHLRVLQEIEATAAVAGDSLHFVDVELGSLAIELGARRCSRALPAGKLVSARRAWARTVNSSPERTESHYRKGLAFRHPWRCSVALWVHIADALEGA